MTEFELIKNYFATQVEHRSDVGVGIGDDAAVISVPANHDLAITTDTLISGIHFPESTLPFDIGYKALAVNLSDLAAMGATPAWITLAITLPNANEEWIQSFCDGFFTLANRYQVQLIGGDLTHGFLSITVQALGLLPTGKKLLRSGAKEGDLIYVTGTLGDAALGLQVLQNKMCVDPLHERYLKERLNRPEPRIETGKKLLDIASAAIDISDGLAADLSHILKASNVGATLFVDELPLSQELKLSVPEDVAIVLALSEGDDYELCFTVPVEKKAALENALSSLPCRYTLIGTITKQPGLNLRYQNGSSYHGEIRGYRHF